MAVDQGLIAWVAEALEPIGPVTSRRMMGGATLYCAGTVFAILSGDVLWFKCDAVSQSRWDDAGCSWFEYQRDGVPARMNYRAAPDDVYDDTEAMREWAVLALEAGARAPVKRKKK